MASPDWQEAVLGDVITVKHGHAFKSYGGPVAPDYQLEPGALVVAMTEQAPGLLGSAGLVPDDEFTT
jgi:hypothetical protein